MTKGLTYEMDWDRIDDRLDYGDCWSADLELDDADFIKFDDPLNSPPNGARVLQTMRIVGHPPNNSIPPYLWRQIQREAWEYHGQCGRYVSPNEAINTVIDSYGFSCEKNDWTNEDLAYEPIFEFLKA